MGTVVMVAAPYCYGPTSKLLCVAEELAASHTLVYVSSEPGLSLARHGPFKEWISIEDRDRWPMLALDTLRGADAIVSFLDYRALRPAHALGVPAIFFDTLHWLRSELPADAASAVSYIAQSFFEKGNTNAVPSGPRWLQVGPVLPRSIERAATRTPGTGTIHSIIVSFGGLRSPAMRPRADIDYVGWVSRIIRSASLRGVSIAFCLPIYMQQHALSIESRVPDAQVCFPYPDEFHDRLACCDLLLTVPGLEAVLEAMYLGVPTIFLPPHNGSQALQLRVYQRLGIALHALQAEASSADPFRGDLNALTREVQAQNALAAASAMLARKLGEDLAAVVAKASANRAWLTDRVRRNMDLLRTLGTRGRRAAADAIESVLQGAQR